jgi:integrase
MSGLEAALNDYLALRRALGFRLKRVEALLRGFVRFAAQKRASFITTDLALRWARLPPGAAPGYCGARLGAVRRFARHVRATDPRTQVPPDGLLPQRFPRKTPYIYSDREVARLLGAARALPSVRGLRAQTHATLLGLLAVSGMRVGEVLALDRGDVDLERGVLTVRRAKFGKTRCIPVHPSTCRALARYARRRDRAVPRPQTPAFFVAERGTRMTEWTLRYTFVKLSRQIGLRDPADRHGPRLHDFRHAFAVKTLLAWYRRGVNVERRLPELATYLGHVHVADTYWYLSATPALLRCVTRMVERGEGQ